MKEAIANAGVFNLIIIFVIILLAFFLGSLSYSKAFKVKNKIVEEIEKDQGFEDETNTNIDTWLGEIGYRVISDNTWQCPQDEGGTPVKTSRNYQYCVYKFDTCEKDSDNGRCGEYYRVIAYMYFDVPIISDLVRIPVKGETITFTTLNS